MDDRKKIQEFIDSGALYAAAELADKLGIMDEFPELLSKEPLPMCGCDDCGEHE